MGVTDQEFKIMPISYGKDHIAQNSFREQIVLQLWINRAHSRVVQGSTSHITGLYTEVMDQILH